MKAKITLLPAIFILMVSLTMAVPLSVIDSKYVSFEDDLLTPAWSIIVQGDNSADYLLFSNPEEIEGEINDIPVRAERGFQLKTSIQKESCDYSLTTSPRKNDIYTYNIDQEAEGVQFWQREQYQQNCIERGSILNYLERRFITVWPVYDVYCVYQDRIATTGEVSEGQMNFDAKFELIKDDGTTLTKTISTIAEDEDGIPPVVTFEENGETVAIIRWIGGSVTGEFCPGQDQVFAIQTNQNIWYTGNNDRYIEYNTQRENIVKVAINDMYNKLFNDPSYLLSEDEIFRLKSAINNNNFRAQAALSEELIATGAQNIGSRVSLPLARDHLIYKPQFNMFIKADWLQLVYLIGRPKIVDSGITTCVEGGTDNKAFATVKNEGNALGKFVAGIKCQEGIFITTTERSITLSPGESGTIEFPFSLDLQQDGKKSCVITVVDSTNPNNKDAASVSADCQATIFCSPEGITKCSGNTELICREGQWQATSSDNCKVITECDRDGKCDTDLGESFETCGGKTASENDCATCNFDGVCDATETIYSCPQDCGTVPQKEIPTWVWIAGGLSAAAVIYYGLTRSKKPRKAKRKR